MPILLRRFCLLSSVIFCVCVFCKHPAAAQDVSILDETVLRTLYEAQFTAPDDTYLQKRIADERETIRNYIELELGKLVELPPEELQLDAEEVPGAIVRQKNIIDALKERLRERRVDLDLLNIEEQKFYPEGAKVASGAVVIEGYRLTKTYQGLLAKRAILEERIGVLGQLIAQQEERYTKLLAEQKMQRYESAINIGQYILLLLIVWFFERLIRRKIFSRIINSDRRYTVTKMFSSLVYIITGIWLLGIIFSKNPGILASFAIVGAGIAIALQDIVKDVFGWFIILQRRLYGVGDRITLGRYTGEVIDIDMLRTVLLEVGIPPEGVLEHTGKILSIPNSLLLSEAITNHSATSEFLNAEMRITITFESDWQKAKTILKQIVREETAEYTDREKHQQSKRTRSLYIQRQFVGPKVFTDIADDGVLFILRFTVPIGERRSVVKVLSEKILTAFNAESNVEFAYKTVRYYSIGEGHKKNDSID